MATPKKEGYFRLVKKEVPWTRTFHPDKDFILILYRSILNFKIELKKFIKFTINK